MKNPEVIVVGGGLAGLCAAIELTRLHHKVLLIEKYEFPFHRVCGEYLSYEIKPFLDTLGIDLSRSQNLKDLEISSPNGNIVSSKLESGGIGISRYLLDKLLYDKAMELGVEFMLNEEVEHVSFNEDQFSVETKKGEIIKSKLVLAAFGKRSKLDKELKRGFIENKSEYVGVKYHIQYEFPKDKIALHNFQGGYCGISAVEDSYCLCYLIDRKVIKKHGSISETEEKVLKQNPFLKDIFEKADFLWEKPLVINEVNFSKKELVKDHILMTGDAAGLITPLCGNGMAIAIKTGLISAKLSSKFLNNKISRTELENQYQKEWKREFAFRLKVGRLIQRFFGDNWLSNLIVRFFRIFNSLLPFVISLTHGKKLNSKDYSSN
jgi:flavin-dependent dehydrogenase